MDKGYREKFENQRTSLTFTVKDFIGSISFPGGRSWSTLSSMGLEGWGVERYGGGGVGRGEVGGGGWGWTGTNQGAGAGEGGEEGETGVRGILRILCPALPCPQLFPPLNLFPSTAKRELGVL